MSSKLMKKNLGKNKIITISLCVFIMLSALLTASSVSIFVKLSSSIQSFFQYTKAPDFVQMHVGAFDQSKIDQFVLQNKRIIDDQQSVTLYNIEGSHLYMNQVENSEENSVMDVAFVKQNQKFDFLMNDHNEVLKLKQGEVAIPIFYQQRDHLMVNDMLYVECNGVMKAYKIVDFIRDVQMNASIISSKRILVSDQDYEELRSYTTPEYLIEFLSKDVPALEMAYQNSDLPHNGTAITKNLLIILNALMDGILAAILFAIALLLVGIAYVCLRFTILMTLEEDVKEIGVMKAIGIAHKDIKKLYIHKYKQITLCSCLVGYVASFFFQTVIFKNIQLYMGTSSPNLWTYLLPLLAISILAFIVLGLCYLILHKLHKITVLQALQNGILQKPQNLIQSFTLRTWGNLPTSLFLSLQDIWIRKRLFLSIIFVAVLSSFLLIVPFNLQSTLEAKDFIRYMGIANSDLRMDIAHMEGVPMNNTEIEAALASDEAVDMYTTFVTYKIECLNHDGQWTDLQVETGDFTKFPLTYLKGSAPTQNNEIAISYVVAKEQTISLDDIMEIKINGQIEEMKISGIYQDITNGGKSAKINKTISNVIPLRSTINVNIKDGIPLTDVLNQYTDNFRYIKITDTQGYMAQTLSGFMQQVRQIVKVAMLVALLITVFQTALFLKILCKKDESSNTILRCIGFRVEHIQLQYILRMLITSSIGILLGTVLANIGGAYIVGLCLQGMGIAQLQFTIIPHVTYIIVPTILLCSIAITTILATRRIKVLHITNIQV